ncbi:hypothetical protein H072_7622 [Dactylellina haptotyla CBS 200.50]|uniref:Uncharacterized protein n=1 Tax=Dactylellina haptotyla (strain CBS 200.50) TaxID=1284197 RepID=S8A725_DACHA|nr:hypothetical protein H072_7622 [Dactylellina haptotyla CBS 200.50]
MAENPASPGEAAFGINEISGFYGPGGTICYFLTMLAFLFDLFGWFYADWQHKQKNLDQELEDEAPLLPTTSIGMAEMEPTIEAQTGSQEETETESFPPEVLASRVESKCEQLQSPHLFRVPVVITPHRMVH